MAFERFISSWLNFTIATKNLLSNEKSYQAWFAATLIQEFGISRVYRELHLEKSQLREACASFSSAYDQLKMHGNEIIPDICITREEYLDTRHSATRALELKDVRTILSKISILSEFKTSSSSKNATAPRSIYSDLLKLGLLSVVAGHSFVPVMCIIEQGDRLDAGYRQRLGEWLQAWPSSWLCPHILVSKKEGAVWDVLHAPGGSRHTGFFRLAQIAH